MKVKILVLMLCAILLCGCSNIKNESIDSIVSNICNSSENYNTYRTGYKYYLPLGLSVKSSSEYNEVIEGKNIEIYLYADIISYFYQKNNDYRVKDNIYYSKLLTCDDKKGYVNIFDKENNKYLIEIMLNYAKIEVMVDEDNLNLSLGYAVSILSSLEYNDNIVDNLLNEDILSYKEEEFNLFDNSNQESEYMKIIEAEKEEQEAFKDEDMIN